MIREASDAFRWHGCEATMTEIVRFDLDFERTFAVPVFSLVGQTPQLLEAFHAALSPHAPVPLAGLQALGGSAMAEVGARVNLFDGLAICDVKPDQYSWRFRGLKAHNAELAETLIVESERTILGVLGNVPITTTSLKTPIWAKVDGGRDRFRAFLRDNVSAPALAFSHGLGAVMTEGLVGGTAEDPEKGWTYRFRFEVSVLEYADLFCFIEANYRHPSLMDRIEAIKRHHENAVRVLFESAGFSLPV
ncbi:MAG: hypothetical protein HC888_19025 [Candidatus Competibacteraceae bacterium]|nr:hypothetical protein [Candidatus Competibacteraceae bacterium]